jgi:hypothetical protein
VSTRERFWASRLRWRLRGAWQWPAFAVLTVADALILHLLPPVSTGIDPFLGLILASFGNLVLVGVVAPWIARRLVERDRRAGPVAASAPTPPEVVLDRAATALLVLGAAGLVAAGLASRPLVVSETEATEANARLVREYVSRHGSDEVRRNVDTANTIRLAEGYFRTCIALDDRRRASCLFVDTTRETVTRDRDTTPNARYRR